MRMHMCVNMYICALFCRECCIHFGTGVLGTSVWAGVYVTQVCFLYQPVTERVSIRARALGTTVRGFLMAVFTTFDTVLILLTTVFADALFTVLAREEFVPVFAETALAHSA